MPGLVIITGKPKVGKSTLAGRINANDWAAGSPLCICDPTGQLTAYTIASGVDLAAVEVVSNASEDPIARAKYLLTLSPPRVVVFYDADTDHFLSIGEQWLAVAAKMQRGVTYSCDEAELVFPNSTHGKDEVGNRRAAILTIARNREVRMVLGTKRPQRLHMDARENATHVCVFRHESDGYLEGCKNFGSEDDYAACAELEQGEYLYRPEFRVKGEPLEHFDSIADPVPFPALNHSL